MTITQHGKYAQLKEGTPICMVSCACGCHFEFAKDDPAIRHKTYPNGIQHHSVKCPECGNEFPIRGRFFLPR